MSKKIPPKTLIHLDLDWKNCPIQPKQIDLTQCPVVREKTHQLPEPTVSLKEPQTIQQRGLGNKKIRNKNQDSNYILSYGQGVREVSSTFTRLRYNRQLERGKRSLLTIELTRKEKIIQNKLNRYEKLIRSRLRDIRFIKLHSYLSDLLYKLVDQRTTRRFDYESVLKHIAQNYHRYFQ